MMNQLDGMARYADQLTEKKGFIMLFLTFLAIFVVQ